MKQHIFSIFDSKTSYFQLPFFSPTIPSGVRLFRNLVSDVSTLVSKYSEDFILFRIGEFDDESGEVSSVVPENLGSGASFKVRED